MSELARKRITKEYDLFRINGPSHGFFLVETSLTNTNTHSNNDNSYIPNYNSNSIESSLTEWRVLFIAPESSIYHGEQYQVTVSFPSTYRTFIYVYLFIFVIL